ncbi:response regulator [Cryptosporangium sp. NPDC051539]|uniref:GGDEF domain-containing response regulator n=1 Tax=Cryptosporangium sp. NPDC051539 TaxID=3363962 RepID=UPI0037922644
MTGAAGDAVGASPHGEGLVLVVDDDTAITALVAMNLRFEGFEVLVANDARGGLAAIERHRPDLVLLDVMMPRVDGYELCRQLRASPLTAALPIIMLTAKDLSADRIQGLTAGADDYITKPFDLTELIARVRNTLRRNREMRDVSPLTGLPGNTRILDAIAERIAARQDHGWEYAVCYIDLDNFKTVNDVYGFYRGDQMLTAAAAALHTSTIGVAGTQPFLGHIGGDDFLVVCTPEQITPITDRAITLFDQASRVLYDPDDLARGYFEVLDRQGRLRRHGLLTLSIGVALSTQRRFADHREVVAAASEMKSVAKRTPGSMVAVDRRKDPEPGRGSDARSLEGTAEP